MNQVKEKCADGCFDSQKQCNCHIWLRVSLVSCHLAQPTPKVTLEHANDLLPSGELCDPRSLQHVTVRSTHVGLLLRVWLDAGLTADRWIGLCVCVCVYTFHCHIANPFCPVAAAQNLIK